MPLSILLFSFRMYWYLSKCVPEYDSDEEYSWICVCLCVWVCMDVYGGRERGKGRESEWVGSYKHVQEKIQRKENTTAQLNIQ